MEWSLGRRSADLGVFALALAGTLGLLVASRYEGVYRFLVREDSVLEWAQVVTYAVVVVVASVSMRPLRRASRYKRLFIVVGLGLFSLIALGEELSWGQRLVGFGTPDVLAQNRQQEANLHNDPRFERLSRVALLLGGLYGVVSSAVAGRRPRPMAPPPLAIPLFVVVAAYFGIRLLFLEKPTYVQAKFSEWPELCFAAGIALWCIHVAQRDREASA